METKVAVKTAVCRRELPRKIWDSRFAGNGSKFENPHKSGRSELAVAGITLQERSHTRVTDYYSN